MVFWWIDRYITCDGLTEEEDAAQEIGAATSGGMIALLGDNDAV